MIEKLILWGLNKIKENNKEKIKTWDYKKKKKGLFKNKIK